MNCPRSWRRRESRLAKIRQAKAALEDEAQARAAEHAEANARERGDDADTAAAKGAAAAEQATPKPKAQRNFTDPDSKIMLTGDGAFHQCYNAQAVVDADHQVIVATDVGTNAADVGNLIAMTEQTAANTGQAPGQMLADAGYCSADNLDPPRISPPSAAPSSTSPPDAAAATTRHRSPRAGASLTTPPTSSAWPASWRPRRASRSTPAARRSSNRSSARCTPCKTPNSYCCADSTQPAANGCCSPPATTYENSTATSA